MSGNIAVIYAGNLRRVAEALGEAAGHLAARVRLLGLAEAHAAGIGAPHDQPSLRDLEWANGIAFGTPIEFLAHSGYSLPDTPASLTAPRLRTAQHRAYRLARLAGVLAEDRARRERLEL